MTKLPTMLDSSATFSPCGRYRYDLIRVWDKSRPTIAFIGLNPSTADVTNNDPTVTRCIIRANQLGFGRMIMLNLFAYRATDPKAMLAATLPVGDDNDDAIRHHCFLSADQVVACWGWHGLHQSRHFVVTKIVTHLPVAKTLWCLGTTANGQPKHPLYVKLSTPLTIWRKRRDEITAKEHEQPAT